MRAALRALLAGATLLGGVAAQAEEPVIPASLAPLFDAAHDEVVARAFVPSEAQKAGEVRLVHRRGADVVQTLLYTKVLSRVVAEIRKKELANWPDGRPGHEDALRYCDALDAARKTVWDRLPKDTPSAERRQKLWIEFALADRAAAVGIGTFEMDESGASVTLRTREPLVLLEPSRDYVRRNMRLIAADSFQADGGALDALVAPLQRLGEAQPAPTSQ